MLGAGLENAILAISIVMIPGFARLIRAQTLAVREETVHRGVALDGHASPGRIRRKRVLPNVASPLIVAVSLAIGFALDRRGPAQPARLRRAAADVELGHDDPGRPARAQRAPVAGVRPEPRARVHDPRLQHPRRRHPRRARPRPAEGQAADQGPPRPHHRHPRRPTRPRRRRPTGALLECPDLSVEFLTESGPGDRRRPRELRRRRRRGRRARRRVRFGQDGLVAGGDAAGRVAARSDHERLGDVRRPRPAVAVVQRDARAARRSRSRWCSRTR